MTSATGAALDGANLDSGFSLAKLLRFGALHCTTLEL